MELALWQLCAASHNTMFTTMPQALHEPAVEAGITLLNEVGLDPGIDHMLAAQCFDEVKSKGGKVSLSDVYMIL